MKVLFELRSEAQRGFDHRSLWELLRERERKATQVQALLSLLLKYGSQFASNRTNRGTGPKYTLTAIAKHASIIRRDKKTNKQTMIAAGTRSFDCPAKQYMHALRSLFERRPLLVLLPANFYLSTHFWRSFGDGNIFALIVFRGRFMTLVPSWPWRFKPIPTVKKSGWLP